MSFSQLLAAGRSFVGLRESPSRYRVVNGDFLPKFGNAQAASRRRTVEAAPAKLAQAMLPMDGPLPAKNPFVGKQKTEPALGTEDRGGRTEDRERRTAERGQRAEAKALSAAPSAPAPHSVPGSRPADAGGEIAKSLEPKVWPTRENVDGGVESSRKAGVEKVHAHGNPSESSAKPSGEAAPNPACAERVPTKGAVKPRWWETPVSAEETMVQSELTLASLKVVRNDLNDADLEVVPLRTRKRAEEGSRSVVGNGERAGAGWGRLARLLALW